MSEQTQTALTGLDLDEIAARAAALYEYATVTDQEGQDALNELTDTDVPALIAAVRAVTLQRDQARGIAVALEQENAELEEQRERRRIRLVACEADLLNMRGLLSPNGFPRRIPPEVEIHERVAPAVDWLLNRVAELEAERAKYVGMEPTVAEEMAYLSRCFFAVHEVCDEAEQGASRWKDPLPVPEWVAVVRAAASGERDTTTAALPWAHAMDDHDLGMFLDDLVSAALNRWRTDVDGPIPDRETLAAIEKACADWRTPGQGLRGDEPGAESRESQ